MDFAYIASRMLVVSLPIALGYALMRLGVLEEGLAEGLTGLTLKVGLPCAVVSALLEVGEMPSRPEVLEVAGLMALAMAVALLVAFGLAYVLGREEGERASYAFAMAFGNAGFIGFPVVSAVLGAEALLFAVIATIPANLFMFSVGEGLYLPGEDGEKGCLARVGKITRGLCTPTMAASLLTLVLALLGVHDLGVVGESVEVVGQMSTPCALLVTGASLARYDLASMFGSWRSWVAAGCRLLVVPLVCWGLLRALGADALIASVVVLECAMPVATNGTLYAIRSSRGVEPMLQVTFLSVVGSLGTIPLLCQFMSM